MAAFLDVCRFNPTLGGTTDWTYSSAVTGYNSPALAGVVNSRIYKYRAESSDLSQWEIGEGAYNTGTGVLARTTVLYNSSGTGTATGQSGAGTKINFSAAPTVAIVAVKEDLLAIEESNNFTATQKSQARTNIAADFVTGTVMLFYQAAAPTGWTKITTQNDKALRVVSGSGGVAGGTNAFSTVMAQTVVGSSTLSTAQLASHSHGPGSPSTAFLGFDAAGAVSWAAGSSGRSMFATGSQGSGSSHNHTITMAIQYIDLILASKD